MSYGPTSWTSSPFSGKPILGGVVLATADPLQSRPRNNGANILDMADGSSVIQLGFSANDGPENASFWEWRFDQLGVVEGDWDAFTDKVALGRAVYWIPYQVETEAFVAVSGATSFTLRRPTAVSQYPSFNTTTFPTRALLNGVEQTVIDTGTPSAGEVKIVGTAITTPALVAADELIVRYYPAYAVVLPNLAINYPRQGELRRQVELVETNLQVPV